VRSLPTLRAVSTTRDLAVAPDGNLGAWLRDLRLTSGLSQTELAATLGTDRRNIRRWEVEGHDPSGTMLLRIFSALGVDLTPAPDGPRAVNAELRDLDGRLAAAEEAAARRHDEVLARLSAQDAELRSLATRRAEPSSRPE
jgi:transcriptional regulator with XRE-family HTH domain